MNGDPLSPPLPPSPASMEGSALAAPLRVERRPSGVAFLRLGDPSARAPVIDERLAAALERAIAELERERDLRGIAFFGPRENAFLYGADVGAISELRDEAEAERLARRGQTLFERIARLPFPTLAAIAGPCVGGGYELALACRHRIAASHEKTRIGLPEVRLGIVPGFGGTQRLPRLVGLARALPILASGKTYPARAARRLGLVDRIVPKERLEEFAEKILLGEVRIARRARSRWSRVADRFGPWRSLVARFARRRVMRETRGLYPAPLRAIECAEKGLGLPLLDGLALEARALASLAVTPGAKNLVRLFFLGEGAKRFARLPQGTEAPPPGRQAFVVGAGTMGGGIAALLADHGIVVRLSDADPAAVGRALGLARAGFEKRRARGRLEPHEVRARLDRLQPTLDGSGLERCDLLVEAVAESLDTKRRLFAEVAERVPRRAILASNTSSLPIGELGRDLPSPERLAGLHFFNPVDRMPLVEIVRGPKTSAETVAALARLSLDLGKTPVVVRDSPGFLVNRILAPYLLEGATMVGEGISPRTVDAAALGFGMPLGPLALLDEVGLDVAQAVCRVLAEAFPPRFRPPEYLSRMVVDGRLGRKSGAGFYRHREGKREADRSIARWTRVPVASAEPLEGESWEDRLLLPLLNEALRTVEEGIPDRPEDVDLACVLGFGFPPFRGGPLRWLQERGAGDLLERARRLRTRHGERFEPCRLFVEVAERRKQLV